MNKKKIAVALTLALGLGGCATPPEQLKSEAKAKINAEVQTIAASVETRRSGLIKADSMMGLPIKMYEEGEVPEDTGNISLSASGQLYPILEEIAKQNGYSVQWMEGVNRNAKTSAAFSGLSIKAAAKRLAKGAGFVAVVDSSSRSIIVAKEAVYTFKVPMHVLQQLDTTYSVGGNPASGANSSNQQSGMSTSAINASFTVNGRTSVGGQSLAGILQNLAGENAMVQVMQESGYITVRSNGQALERVRDFLSKMTANMQRRIEIEATVIEVILGDQFSYGVDWSRVLGGSSPISIALTGGANTIANPGLKATYTSGGLEAIMAALNTVTNAKIVSSARVSTTNRIPATIFDGQQIPYLGSIASTVQQISTTVSGTANYASDGISLSIIPDIFSDSEAQVSLVPVISGVQEFTEFDLGLGAKIVAPKLTFKDSFVTTMLSSGQTVVIGGIGFKSGQATTNNLPVAKIPMGSKDESKARETAIVLQAKIIPAKRRDVLFSEHI